MNNFNSSVTQSVFLGANPQSSNPQSLTDQNLYSLCKTYGARALEWRRKFTGLLPEVNRRRLFEKKGFVSIFVFAKKLAGLSENQVRRVLNLEEKFREFPALLSLLVNGDVSVNKLTRVASIANLENQVFLAERVKILSQGAVEAMVRDERWVKKICGDNTNDEGGILGLFSGDGCLSESSVLDNFNGRRENVGWMVGQKSVVLGKNKNGLIEPGIESKSVRAHTLKHLNFSGSSGGKSSVVFGVGHSLNLSSEVQRKLLELQQKGLDLDQLLLEFLERREEEIAHKKAQIAEEVLRKEEKQSQNRNRVLRKEEGKVTKKKMGIVMEKKVQQNQDDVRISSPSRYIPCAVRKIIHEEHGTKCSIRTCQKTAKTIHHTQRFSLSTSHNPHYLAPLCKDHHELAHACDVKYGEVKREYLWKTS